MTVLPKPHLSDYGTTLMSTKYPPPLYHHNGNTVSWYTYKNEADAKRASIIAEHVAITGGGINHSWLYHLPGQIIVNSDGTYTVTVV